MSQRRRIKCYKFRRNRDGKEVNRQVTMIITHEKTREVTREDVDRAIDVIERHLEKEARTPHPLGRAANKASQGLLKAPGLGQGCQLARKT